MLVCLKYLPKIFLEFSSTRVGGTIYEKTFMKLSSMTVRMSNFINNSQLCQYSSLLIINHFFRKLF